MGDEGIRVVSHMVDPIHFDKLHCESVDRIWKSPYWIISDPNRRKYGSVGYDNYTLQEGFENQATQLDGITYWLHAFANRFNVSRSLSWDGEKGEERDGFVFDGTLWVGPKEATKENYGVSGQIRLWVPQEVSSLSSLLTGGTASPKELDARLNAIRKGYIQNQVELRKDEDTRVSSAGDKAFNSGRWHERHGSFSLGL